MARSSSSGFKSVLTRNFLNSSSGCTEHHMQMRRVLDSGEMSERFGNLYPPQFPLRDTPLWKDLELIPFTSMRLGQKHTGQMIFGELMVDAFPVTSKYPMVQVTDSRGQQMPQVHFHVITVITAIKDLLQFDGECCLRLDIKNSAKTTDSFEDLQKNLPRNLRVIILEPEVVFSPSQERKGMLRVDNPADIILDCYSVCTQSKYFLIMDDVQPRIDGNLKQSVERLMNEANVMFTNETFREAVYRYSVVVELISRALCEDGNRGLDSEYLKEKIIWAYTNRAEALLRLHSYHDAWKDACCALDFNYTHVKSFLRGARASQGLKLYRVAHDMYEAALRIAHIQGAAGAAHQQMTFMKSSVTEMKTRVREIVHGEYDLSLFYHSGSDATLNFADYVGPVTVRQDCKGLGLVATRDVEPGELVFVNNAVVFADWQLSLAECFQNRNFYKDKILYAMKQNDFFATVLDVVKSSPQELARLYALGVAHGLGEGRSNRRNPVESICMDIFKHDREYVPDPESHKEFHINVGRIRRILCNCKPFFGGIYGLLESLKTPAACKWEEERQSSTLEKLSEAHAYCGVWVPLNFLRHSCMPNSWVLRVGSAVFVRCLKKVTEGEEFTICHSNGILHDVLSRENMTERFAADCNCPRCAFEKEFGDLTLELKNHKIRFQSILGSVNVPSADPCPYAMLKDMVGNIESIISKATAEWDLSITQEGWLRAIVLDPYLQLVLGEKDGVMKIKTLRLILNAFLAIGDPRSILNCLGDILTAAKEVYSTNSKSFRAVKEEIFTTAKGVMGTVSMTAFKKLMRNSFEVICNATDGKRIWLASPEYLARCK